MNRGMSEGREEGEEEMKEGERRERKRQAGWECTKRIRHKEVLRGENET